MLRPPSAGRARWWATGYEYFKRLPTGNLAVALPPIVVFVSLPLTGERTVPGIAEENYWFRRHEAAYVWILDRFGAGFDESVLVDAGCGEGYGAALMASRAGLVVGLELDPAAVAHVGSVYRDPVRAVRSNLDALPMAPDSADYLISMQVVEHLWDLPRFLAESRRVVKPGGTAVFATPNRLTFSPGLGRGEKPTNPFHVEEFDAEQMVELCKAAGFGEVVVYGLHHDAQLAAWEKANGSIVAAQIDAVMSEQWPASLLEQVAQVSIHDFAITTENLDASSDLIAVCS